MAADAHAASGDGLDGDAITELDRLRLTSVVVVANGCGAGRWWLGRGEAEDAVELLLGAGARRGAGGGAVDGGHGERGRRAEGGGRRDVVGRAEAGGGTWGGSMLGTVWHITAGRVKVGENSR